jgi:uncharacterized coiled-coil protein SlyX
MVLPWPITDMSDQDECIEELESKVEQLEATIRGLTEELVEVHDRLETLESSEDATDERTRRGRSEDSDTQKDKNDDSKSDESQKEDETGGDSELGDDIIVA